MRFQFIGLNYDNAGYPAGYYSGSSIWNKMKFKSPTAEAHFFRSPSGSIPFNSLWTLLRLLVVKFVLSNRARSARSCFFARRFWQECQSGATPRSNAIAATTLFTSAGGAFRDLSSTRSALFRLCRFRRFFPL